MGLNVITGKQTKWEGLWWHPEYHGFSSAAINLAQLKKFRGCVRLYVRKNKFFNNGENGKPNYHFCLKDANSATFTELEVFDDEDESESDETFTREQMEKVKRGACLDGQNGYSPGDLLIEDYL